MNGTQTAVVTDRLGIVMLAWVWGCAAAFCWFARLAGRPLPDGGTPSAWLELALLFTALSTWMSWALWRQRREERAAQDAALAEIMSRLPELIETHVPPIDTTSRREE